MSPSDLVVSVVPPHDRRLRQQFIKFPHRLYADNKQWVPFFNIDMRAFLTRRHPYYQNYPAQFFIASRGEEVVGTLSVSYNHAFNNSHDINTAHFFFYEVIDDLEVTRALFAHGEEWAREYGAEHIMGPFLSGMGSGSGLLIEGFEYPGTMTMMRYNPPYYERHLTELGFGKYADLNSYSCRTKTIKLDPRVERMIEVTKKRGRFKLMNLKSTREIVGIAHRLFDDFLNKLIGSYAENYPLALNEQQQMLKDLKFILRKDCIIGLTYQGNLAGYGLGFPDITAAMQKSKGKITPISIIRLLHAKYHTSYYCCNGVGILPEYQRLGGGIILYSEFFRRISQTLNPIYAELTQIGETTESITSELEEFIEKKTKVHRILTKKI